MCAFHVAATARIAEFTVEAVRRSYALACMSQDVCWAVLQQASACPEHLHVRLRHFDACVRACVPTCEYVLQRATV